MLNEELLLNRHSRSWIKMEMELSLLRTLLQLTVQRSIQQSLMEERLKNRFWENSLKHLRLITICKLGEQTTKMSLWKNSLSIIIMCQHQLMKMSISIKLWIHLGI